MKAIEKTLTLKKAIESGNLDDFVRQEETRLKAEKGYPPSFGSFTKALKKLIRPR